MASKETINELNRLASTLRQSDSMLDALGAIHAIEARVRVLEAEGASDPTPTLRPCPHCGSTALRYSNRGSTSYVDCRTCGSTIYFYGKRNVEEMWNHRADDALYEFILDSLLNLAGFSSTVIGQLKSDFQAREQAKRTAGSPGARNFAPNAPREEG